MWSINAAVTEVLLVCYFLCVCEWANEMRMKPTAILYDYVCINTLRPRQNGRHFADDVLKCIFLNEDVWIPTEISLKFVPKGPIDNIPALV